MKPTEKMDYLGRTLLKKQATSDGIYHAAICMLQFPMGYLQMKHIEEMGLFWIELKGLSHQIFKAFLWPTILNLYFLRGRRWF